RSVLGGELCWSAGGKGDLQPQLDNALQDINDMYLLLEETEKQAVRKALIEERGRFCTFITFLQPVVNGELTMLGEITHLQGIIEDLVVLIMEPHKLPPASEQVIKDLKGSDHSWSYLTTPSSSARMFPILWVLGAVSCAGGRSGGKHVTFASLSPPSAATTCLSIISSHYSGFISQDTAYSKPPSPMPLDITSQVQGRSELPTPVPQDGAQVFPPCQRNRVFPNHPSPIIPVCTSPPPGSMDQSFPSSCILPSAKDNWSKASPYYQPLVPTLQRCKDRVEHLREAETGSPTSGYPSVSGEEAPRSRVSLAMIHEEELSPATSDLAMILTRGLSLEHQKSSWDSLQHSSGYSTQTTTPSCSKDTIHSQGTWEGCDPQSNFNKSSTIPRNSNIAQNYRRMIQTKRPASTAGLPTGTNLPAGTTPGVATICRTLSTKPSVHRILSNCVFYADNALPNPLDFAKASPKRLSLPNTAWGGGAMEISVYPGASQHLSDKEEEDQQLATNRHSLVEKISELAASTHALDPITPSGAWLGGENWGCSAWRREGCVETS
uniref:IMD domain-containing protein n=1 Tax=Amazona collaria TaxID=241587 RepID=A0A8B9GEQ7_9PSIT